MSTNRTKTDWAYKQALKITNSIRFGDQWSPEIVRRVAAIVRKAERRGAKAESQIHDDFADDRYSA